MAEQTRITCTKCGKSKPADKEFFKRRDGEREPMCKDCLTMFIDNRDRTTFEWILEKMDVPYVEDNWIKIYNEQLQKKGKVSSNGVLGRYLRDMQMKQWRPYKYADSDRLNAEIQKNREEIASRMAANSPDAAAKLAELQDQLDRGEITEAQFNTLNPINALEKQVPEFLEYAPDGSEVEEEILSKLEEDEIYMLRQKWGNNYRPSQWVKLESTYVEYENEFELNSDRRKILIQICKVYLEMEECLAVKDYKSYRDLCSQYESLRKSGKFTEAQNKEGNEKYLDTIGELAKFCEQEGGLIEMLPNPDDYPQDKIDFTIKDIKNYIQNLVRGELGLGALIENYIKKLEAAEAAKEQGLDLDMALPDEGENEDYLTQEEAEEWQFYLENGLEEEAEQIARLGGGY